MPLRRIGRRKDETALAWATRRFWSRVQKSDGCWLWQGSKDKDGYGVMMMDKQRTKAHRFAYLLAHGGVPSDLLVCHHCDTPSCVRPDHLFAGTDQENLADMQRKGRKVVLRGEASPKAKLTQDQVAEIRQLAKEQGYRSRRIAKLFGIARQTAKAILTGSAWADSYVEPLKPKGEVKLDADKVREIRRLAGEGLPRREIAQRFGIHYMRVSLIAARKTWKHVSDDVRGVPQFPAE